MEELFFYGVPDSAGEYTTVIFVNDQPVPAFGGKTYLDWTCPGRADSMQIIAEIDPSVIPREGQCVMYAVTLNRSRQNAGESGKVITTSRLTVFGMQEGK